MATAKLWWNGSSWATSSKYWVNHNSTDDLGFGVVTKIQIIAYDNATIGLVASLNPSVNDQSYSLSGTKTIKGGTTTLLSLSDSNRNPAEVTATSYSSFSYSGNISVYRMAGGVQYGDPSYISGSTTITSPFCTITYNANGGSGAPSAATVCKNVASVLSSTIPTRSGYSFLGWAASSSATTATYSAGGSIAPTGNTTLYAVWQAQLTTITASNGTIDSALTITLTQQGSSYSYKHDIKWTIVDQNGTSHSANIATNQTSSNQSFTVSWTPSGSTIVPYFTDRKTYSCTLTVTTKTSGGTSLGTKTNTISLTVPSSYAPTFTTNSVTASGNPTGVTAYVKGKTKAYFNYTVSPQYSATIVSWKFTANGATTTQSSTATTKTYTSAELTSGSVSVTITDSRGLSRTDTKSLMVVDYASPTATSVSIARATSGGTLDSQGTYLKVTGTLKVTPNVTAISGNAHKYQIKYREQGTSTWTNAKAETDMGSNTLSLSFLSSSAILNQSKSYEVQLIVKDSFETTTLQQTVSTAAAIIDFKANGKGVAFGKVSEIDKSVELADDWTLWCGYEYPIVLKNKDYAYTDTPSSTSYRRLHFADKNDYVYGIVRSVISSSEIGLYLAGRRGGVYNTLGLYVDVNGNRRVSIDATPWLEALGLGTSGALPITIAQGGSGQTGTTSTTTVSDVITENSGITISAIKYAEWGKMAQLYITFKCSSQMAYGVSQNVGTLKTGKRPKIDSFANLYQNSALGYITTGGVVYIRPSANIAANTTSYIYAMYLLA